MIHTLVLKKVIIIEFVIDESEKKPIIEYDYDLNKNVISIIPGSRLFLPTNTQLDFLILYLKTVDAFFRIEIELVTKSKKYKRIILGNDCTNVKICPNVSYVPIICKPNWNYMPINIGNLCMCSFGEQMNYVKLVVINSHCKIYKVFFERYENHHQKLISVLQVDNEELIANN